MNETMKEGAKKMSSSDAAKRREHVVLLHGLGRSAANMLVLKWRLERMNYRVCNIGYDTRVKSIDVAVRAVYSAIREFEVPTDAPMHFVTHSLGGLVMRALFAELDVPQTGRAVMLAPPNSGSEIADWLRRIGWTESLMGPLATQLGTRDQDLPQQLPKPPIPFAVIAGDQWINPIGPVLLPAPHDGTVSVSSTRLLGMADHLVVPATHTFIMNRADVASQIDAFLRQGRFRRFEARD
jgi:pimeloyl-ACP methyl ester carboxylesterase